MKTLPPMHLGEVLREEFMEPMGLSAITVARAINVPRTRIERVVREVTGVSADTALRLSKLFGTTPEFWLNLQARYDMETTEKAISEDLASIQRLEMEAA